MIILYINGEEKHINIDQNSISISDLIIYLDYVGKRIAIELNGEIAPKSKFDQIMLQNNDKLEIITAVGGG